MNLSTLYKRLKHLDPVISPQGLFIDKENWQALEKYKCSFTYYLLGDMIWISKVSIPGVKHHISISPECSENLTSVSRVANRPIEIHIRSYCEDESEFYIPSEGIYLKGNNHDFSQYFKGDN